MERKLIEEQTESVRIGIYCGTLGSLKVFVDELVKSGVPEDAYMWKEEDYDGVVDLFFKYKRPETDEEYEQRTNKEFWEQKRKEDDELAMYRILKAKFENNKEQN